MRCLVTGCAGFIGSHLCDRLLTLGHDVIGIDAFTEYYSRELKEENIAGARSSPHFTFHQGDLRSLPLDTLVADVDVIFHLAAQAGVRASWGDDFELYTQHNMLAMQRLLEACRGQEGLTRFVYASSSSVYGELHVLPIREDTPTRPVSPYGVTKLAGEHLAYVYAANFGVPSVVLRYFSVYGARQRPDMAYHRFIASAMHGEPIVLFDGGTQTRDFTHVEDVVQATILAAQLPQAIGRTYNIAGGARIPLLDALATIGRLTDRELTIHHALKQAGDVRDTYADVAAARQDLGYEPSVSLARGLRDEVGWYMMMRVFSR